MKVKEEYANIIKDKGFRDRFISEFQRVTSWTESLCDLENANIYDFGCGAGIAALSFALNYPNATVYGSDIVNGIDDRLSNISREQLELEKLPKNLFLSGLEAGKIINHTSNINLIYSWSVFEHVRRDQIIDILLKLKASLAKGGLFYLQINPLYFSSRGAHLYTHVSEPWCHLTDQHDVLKQRVFSSGNNRQQYDWEQYKTLNRITVDELMAYFEEAGFKLLRELRIQSELQPSQQLLDIYNKDVLLTDEIMALFTV